MNTQNPGQISLYVFIALLAFGFTGWFYITPWNVQKLSPDLLSRLPNAVFYNIHATQFDANGNLSNTFFSPKLTHFPNTNSNFDYPRIVLYSTEGEEPWHVQSDKGLSTNNTEIITLTQNVILHQNEMNTKPARTMTTSSITYYPKTQNAISKEMVFFEQAGLFVKSLGMTANLKTQKINLSEQVWSEYQPNAK